MTLFVVVALYAVGGEVLRDFSFVLIVGFISGVYSTVYIASTFVVAWRGWFTPRRASSAGQRAMAVPR
jgi:preprotein translocase subunit SecF